jgi:hypothetical protein
MKQSDLISLQVCGVKILVLDKPKVLETDPTWLLVLCQLCSDLRLMQLKWHRQEGRRFPMLLNTLKLRDTLEVSGEFVMHTFVDNGVLVCNRSIIATSVEIYSPSRVVHDGCEIPTTTVGEARTEKDIQFCIKYLRKKIEMDSLTEQVNRMQVSKGSTTGLSATGNSPSRKEERASNLSSGDNEVFSSLSTSEKGRKLLNNRGWVHKPNIVIVPNNMNVNAPNTKVVPKKIVVHTLVPNKSVLNKIVPTKSKCL